MTTLVRIDEDGVPTYYTEPLGARDHFAIAALQKALDTSVDYRQAAERAYQVADHMMKERSKQ